MSLESNIELLTGALLRIASALEGRGAASPAPAQEPAQAELVKRTRKPKPEPEAAAPEPAQAELVERPRKPKPEPEAAAPEPEQAHKLGTEAPTILESDVRALLVSLTRKTGSTAAALGILAKFGGATVAAVDQDKWPLVIDAATEALEGEAA